MKLGFIREGFKDYICEENPHWSFQYDDGSIVVITEEYAEHYSVYNNVYPDSTSSNDMIVPKRFIQKISTE